jgi:hypothetical protein
MNRLKFFFLAITLIIWSACGDGTPKAKNASTQSATSNVESAKPAQVSKNTINTTNAQKVTQISKKVTVFGKDINVPSGSEFCVDVKVNNFVDIISMQYSTNWDTNLLEYKEVKSFNLKDLGAQSFGRAKGEESTLRLAWFAQDLKGVSLFDGASIYQVCFKAIGKSGTTTKIDFDTKPMIGEFANSKYKTVEFELKEANITIQ